MVFPHRKCVGTIYILKLWNVYLPTYSIFYVKYSLKCEQWENCWADIKNALIHVTDFILQKKNVQFIQRTPTHILIKLYNIIHLYIIWILYTERQLADLKNVSYSCFLPI